MMIVNNFSAASLGRHLDRHTSEIWEERDDARLHNEPIAFVPVYAQFPFLIAWEEEALSQLSSSSSCPDEYYARVRSRHKHAKVDAEISWVAIGLLIASHKVLLNSTL
jgi:hypothetical protein